MDGLRSPLALTFLIASSLGLACGGTFKSGSDNAGGGAGTGSGGGSAGRMSCVYGGKLYADGARFKSVDGCNACACSDGEVGCDEAACDNGCDYEGKHYGDGQSFPSGDGCNNCSCGKGGSVACTDKACSSCQDTQTSYARAVEEARRCDPQANNQCLGKLGEGLQCSCGVFINETNVEAIDFAKQAAGWYTAANCGGGVLCGACATPLSGYCSQAGRCETLWQEGPRACKVGGVVYADGETGIPDPTSCNKCACNDGKLSCTEINCPLPCPAEQGFASQCALCGPTDECLIVEHTCLPTCSPDGPACAEGACSAGICRNSCG